MRNYTFCRGFVSLFYSVKSFVLVYKGAVLVCTFFYPGRKESPNFKAMNNMAQ